MHDGTYDNPASSWILNRISRIMGADRIKAIIDWSDNGSKFAKRRLSPKPGITYN